MSNTLISPDARPRSELRPKGTSFAGLVGVELRRLWWRRLTKAVLAGILLFVVAMVYNAYNSSTPERLAQQIDSYKIMLEENKRQQAEMKDQLPQMLKDCREQQAAERERTGDPGVDFRCDAIGTIQNPTLEEMGIVVPIADTITQSVMEPLVSVGGLLVLILMGSFVAAEFTAGSMGNWLTFKPRRLEVAASKLAAAAIGATALAAAAVLLLVLGAHMVATVNRPGSDLQLPDPPPLDESLGQLVLRAVVLVMLSGLIGATLGLLVRYTAAVIGFVLGYIVLVEGFAVNALLQGRLTPFAIVPNAFAFLQKGHPYRAERCTADGCTFAEQTITYTHGWVYLLVVSAALVAGALAAFRRRDVT